MAIRLTHGPYSASFNSNHLPVVSGPGDGFGYYDTASRLTYLVCDSDEEANRSSEIANRAYQEGYRKAQADICKALGVKV